MSEVDPGSYVEIQMDRQTVVLGAVGFLVLMALAFMLGRWTAPDAAPQPSVEAATGEERGDADGGPSVEEQAVDGEPMFGDRVVSAAGAPPIAPVPARSTAAPVGAPSRPATGGVPATAADPPVTPPTRTTPAEPRPRAREVQAVEPATAAGSVGGWVIQVAAVKEASEARALERKLGGKGYPVRVVVEGEYHKVQVGPFGRKSEAQVVERRLKREENLATWLKSL